MRTAGQITSSVWPAVSAQSNGLDLSIASLSAIKAHLRFPEAEISGPSDDDEIIQGLADAADGIIANLCDDVLPTRHVELFDGGDISVWTRHKPIVSVESVVEGWGYLNFDLDFQEVNSPGPFSIFAYSIDSYSEGQITRRSAGNVTIPYRAGESNIEVAYTSGRAVVPPALVLAEKMLVAHMYQNELLRAEANSSAYMQYDVTSQSFAFSRETGTTTINYGIPLRVQLLIDSERRGPIFA